MARTFYLESYGCQQNVHDAERMAGLLEAAGFEAVDDPTLADIVVINTCSVRERAEDKLFHRLDEIRYGIGRGPKPVIAVTGCVAQQEGRKLLERAPDISVIVGTQAMRRLPVLVEHAFTSDDPEPRIDLNPQDDASFPLGIARRGDPVKAYVTIIEGCNDFCAFCVVPYTRGHERMRSVQEILGDVHEAVASGRREVQLIGQIVNHYQAPDDPRCDFAELLARIDGISGVERIRFASPHPRHVTPRLIDAIAHLPRVCKHIHLPVQSGSTRVLQAMRRRHSREEYLDLIDRLRAAVPGIQFSTDMIIGFPGETAADFDETMSLTAAVGYHSMFSFKYSERPMTLASKRLPDDVPEDEKTARIVALQAAQKAIQATLHASTVGTDVDVLVDAQSRRREHEVSGRTTGNTVVNFPGESDWIGRLARVRIERAGPHSLSGTVVAVESGAGGEFVPAAMPADLSPRA